jgi:hypothetical protein
MHEPRALADSPGAGWTLAHGLGLQVWNSEGRRQWGHGGSVPGFTAELRCDPAAGDAVALCSSATHAVGAGGDLLALLAATEPAPVRPWQPHPEQAELTPLCGTWYWGPNPYVLTALTAAAPDRRVRLSLAPLGAGRRTTTFERDPSGRWIGVEGDYWLGEELRPLTRADHTPSALDAPGAFQTPYAIDIATFHFTRLPYEPGTDVPGETPGDAWR